MQPTCRIRVKNRVFSLKLKQRNETSRTGKRSIHHIFTPFVPTCKLPAFVQNKFTGSISTAIVTSSGSVSAATILARAWLSLLIERVRSMIW